MVSMDEFTTSADIGRINPAEDYILTENVNCPEMVFSGREQIRNTMSLKQCVIRYQMRNPCVQNCRIIRNYLEPKGVKFDDIS